MTITLGVFYLFILNPAIHRRPLASCCMSRFSPVPLLSSPLSSTSLSAVGAPAGDNLRKPQNKWIKMLSQGLDSRTVFFFSWFSYFTQLTNEGVALPKERAYKYWLSYAQTTGHLRGEISADFMVIVHVFPQMLMCYYFALCYSLVLTPTEALGDLMGQQTPTL